MEPWLKFSTSEPNFEVLLQGRSGSAEPLTIREVARNFRNGTSSLTKRRADILGSLSTPRCLGQSLCCLSLPRFMCRRSHLSTTLPDVKNRMADDDLGFKPLAQ
jgi:hypothetical protein